MTKAARWLLLSNISRYAGQFGLLSTIALTLGDENAGRYALALAITAPVFVFAGLGMRTVLFTLTPAQELRHYMVTRLTSLVLGLLIVVAIGIFFDSALAITLLLVALMKCTDSFNELNVGILQLLSHERRTVIITGAPSAVMILAALVGTIWFSDLNLILVSVTGTTLFTSAMVYLAVARPVSRSVDSGGRGKVSFGTTLAAMRTIIRAGIPTGFSDALLPLMVGIPQYTLTLVWGPTAVAQLSTLLYLQLAVELVVNSISQAWLVHGRRIHVTEGLTIRGIINIAIRWEKWAALVAAFSIAIGLLMFPILFGDAFQPSAINVALIGLGSLILPFVYASLAVLPIKNMYGRPIVANLAATLASLISTSILVPAYGVSGGLASILIGMMARAGGSLILGFGDRR